MKLRINKLLLGIGMASLILAAAACTSGKDNKKAPESPRTPNVVIIFLDDAGWADFQPFHETPYPTPNVEKLAKEGCTYTNFYVPQAICSASRASLLTGCYPGRTKIFGALAPRQKGLSPDFATMGEVLSKNGYATALFGKWHLGDQPGYYPQDRGFDETCGLMYSNDMWKDHPVDPEFWGKYPMQYWENGEVTNEDVSAADQEHLTSWYTEKAVHFIHENKTNPFFLYVPHSMPHVPIFCSDKFRGASGTGRYGDVMMELDWSVGQIMQALTENGLKENTLVIFTSDNGPWHTYGNRAGQTPFREAKATSFDGGIRSPCIMRYPGHIDAGSHSRNTFFSIDLLPTICELTGTPLPDNEIDGKDVRDLILNRQGADNPHEYYAFSNGNDFQGVMSGDGNWKLHVPHGYRTLVKAGIDGQPGKYRQDKTGYALFDMVHDAFEKGNVIDQYPDIANELKQYARMHEERFYGSE